MFNETRFFTLDAVKDAVERADEGKNGPADSRINDPPHGAAHKESASVNRHTTMREACSAEGIHSHTSGLLMK